MTYDLYLHITLIMIKCYYAYGHFIMTTLGSLPLLVEMLTINLSLFDNCYDLFIMIYFFIIIEVLSIYMYACKCNPTTKQV